MDDLANAQHLDYAAFIDKAIAGLMMARASVMHMAVYDDKEDIEKCLEWLLQAKGEVEFLIEEMNSESA